MSNDLGSDASKKDGGKKQEAGRVHVIAIDSLIIHKYSGSADLLRKADKVAREIIDAELREGEYVQVIKPGKYRLHLPKLRPDAGQLRCSIMINQIERAIRRFNPTSFQLHEAEDGMLTAPGEKGAPIEEHAGSAAPQPPSVADAEEAEMRKMASQAMKMMAGETVTREELVGSEIGRLLQADIELKFVPVWNVKNGLITAYECLTMPLSDVVAKNAASFQNADIVEIKAIVDMIVYELAGAELKKRFLEQNKALLLCPVHASTLDNPRYASAFLGSGVGIPPAAQKSLVFLVKDLKAPFSRLKLRELTGYLRSRSRGLVADLPINVADVSLFKELGFHGVRASASARRVSEVQLLKMLNLFVVKCEAAKLESFIGDLKTNSAALGALSSGCSYLSGSAIAQHSSKRGAIEMFELDSLFSKPTP